MAREPQGALPAPAPPRTYEVSSYGGVVPGGGPERQWWQWVKRALTKGLYGTKYRVSPPGSARSSQSIGMAGRAYKAAAASSATSRIDPGQMPRPPRPHVGALYETKTNNRKVPPVANTSMTVVDTGYCSPRFLRLTMAAPPISAAMHRMRHALRLPRHTFRTIRGMQSY